MRSSIPRSFKALTQRVLFAFEQFSRHEMANHAAAGSYSFLLSAIPAVLVILYISSIAVSSFDSTRILRLLGLVIDAFGGKATLEAFMAKPLAGFTGAFGLINLIWAARLFVVSIQRGIRVVYSDAATINQVRESLLTFAVELVVIIAVVLVMAASQVARTLFEAIDWIPATALLGIALKTGFRVLPFVSLWLFVFMTYRNIPSHKPPSRIAALNAILCVTSYSIFGYLLGFSLNAARYGLLYGILGNLIAGLIKVYFFFWLYFFFAELGYTMEFFDSLLFARFHRVSSAEKPAGRIERALFAEPGRLFRRFAREFVAGQTIFAKGDQDRSALYLYKGSVDIDLVPPEERRGAALSTVNEGELFGEMAWILEEPRSAWATATSDCTIFVLPPEVFERFLAQDAGGSMRLATLLAERLRANNEARTRSASV
ncbi:MAG TPA: YhjD/YihY/BrkB family envelope integrity protein [bacterium]|nr:YhjD/YihY/BrkB family envelope integrity protein [bacterium]